MANDQEYWASLPASECVDALEQKHNDFNDMALNSGLKKRWISSYNYYFGKHFTSANAANDTDLMSGGREGELTLMKANNYRNVIRHMLAMTTQQLPSFECRATNADVDSINQTRLSSNIVEYYFNEKRVNRNANESAEHSLVFGSGYVHAIWDPKLGEQYQVDEKGRPVYEGDILVSTPSVFDVRFDQSKADFGKLDWVDIREAKNKFDLSARYPHLKEKILSLKSRNDEEFKHGTTISSLDETSDVFVYYFYHRRTEAMPNGRFVLYCDSDTILYDGPIPYKRLPLFQICPGRFFGSPFGYTDNFDLLGVQDALNTLFSTVLSNNVAFGAQNILVPEGSNITREQLSESLSMITYNNAAGKPEPLQLTASSPETYGLIDRLNGLFDTLSGMNAVSRGQVDSGNMSGVAISLIQSMAIQYSSGFQRSWAELLEDLGTFIIELLQTFASSQRMIGVAGKSQSAYMKSFTKEDISDVKRVTVKLGNPLARTTSGKVAIADALLSKGLVQNAKEYLTVLETGNLEPLTQHTDAKLSLVRAENEAIMSGDFQNVKAMVGDAHIQHTQEHMSLLANPLVRMNANITAFVLHHCEEHEKLYQSQNPFYALVSGEPPAQPNMFMPSGIAPPPPPMAPPMAPQMQNIGGLPVPPPPKPNAKNIELPPPGPLETY